MTEAEWLAALPDMVFRAILLLARIGAVVMIMPGLGEQEVPSNYRLGLGLALVAVLYPVLSPALPRGSFSRCCSRFRNCWCRTPQ
jgi:flagellar biosynthetic protein FliR